MISTSAVTSELQRQIDLSTFLNRMTNGKVTSLESKSIAPWFETGIVYEITQELFWFHVERIPAKWTSSSMFVSAEGDNLFRLFWEKGNRFFARELTSDETELFCQLSGDRIGT